MGPGSGVPGSGPGLPGSGGPGPWTGARRPDDRNQPAGRTGNGLRAQTILAPASGRSGEQRSGGGEGHDRGAEVHRPEVGDHLRIPIGSARMASQIFATSEAVRTVPMKYSLPRAPREASRFPPVLPAQSPCCISAAKGSWRAPPSSFPVSRNDADAAMGRGWIWARQRWQPTVSPDGGTC